MKKKKLLNCPFCNGRAKFELAGFAPIGAKIQSGFVSCQNVDCDAMVYGDSKTEAVNKWNSRYCDRYE
jgi:transcription elongation factor Elf1